MSLYTVHASVENNECTIEVYTPDNKVIYRGYRAIHVEEHGTYQVPFQRRDSLDSLVELGDAEETARNDIRDKLRTILEKQFHTTPQA